MFEKMTEQFQNSLYPVNDMFANNTRMVVKLAEQQTRLFTDVMNESLAYTKRLSEQKDIPGVLNVQKDYVESVFDKVMAASENANKLFSEAQEEASQTVKPIFTQNKPAAAETPRAPKAGK